jgi:poly(3-hydroxybutyrate) depolymerase
MKTRLVRILSLAFAYLITSRIAAIESASERHALATNQIQQIAAQISADCLTSVRTLADWQNQRPVFRHQLLEMLGLDPLPKKSFLYARLTGRIDRPDYSIEKIVFESLPGLYVTGNFYLPKKHSDSLPAVLYLCGHSPGPAGAKVPYQDRVLWYPLHGFACLILDTVEFGEVPGIHHGTHNLNMWNWLSLGYTPAGIEVWNAMRALDFLESRPEIDPKHIGLTGISGGGAMTWYTAALDDRVAAAAPVCSTFTIGSQASHWLASGQCDCIYYPNSYRWDFPVVGALIAPRPLLILSGQRDPIFPPDGYHSAFQHAKKVYDLYPPSGESRIRELDDDVEHSDPPLFRRSAHEWMQKWLQSGATTQSTETNLPPLEAAATLACLTELPPDAINYRIQNEFVTLPVPQKPHSKTDWSQKRSALIPELRSRIFGWFPTNTPPFESIIEARGGGWASLYCNYKDCSFATETGVRVHVQFLGTKTNAATAPLLIYSKRSGDSIYPSDFDELLPLLGRFNVVIVNTRFTEQTLSSKEYTDIERSSAWIGRTIAGMQVWDLLRTIDWALREQKLAPSSISLYGKGDMGIVSLYAALFDERVQTVVLNEAPSTHWEHPALLNILRVTDIPQVAAAFAPRKLVSLTGFGKGFDYTRNVYRLIGAASNLTRSQSLPDALNLSGRSQKK